MFTFQAQVGFCVRKQDILHFLRNNFNIKCYYSWCCRLPSDRQIKIHMSEVVRFILTSHFCCSCGANNPDGLTVIFWVARVLILVCLLMTVMTLSETWACLVPCFSPPKYLEDVHREHFWSFTAFFTPPPSRGAVTKTLSSSFINNPDKRIKKTFLFPFSTWILRHVLS